MCADFNYYLNRQGAPGLQGEKGDKGDKGDSITVSTGVNTPTEYTLIFDKGDGNSFETGNLKYPMRDDGGTYLRYDRTNNTVVLGYPNIAELNGNAGEVQLATTVTVGNSTVQNKDAVSYELFKSVKDSTDSELTSLDGRVTYLEQHGGGGGGGTTFTPGAGLNMTSDNVLYVETDSTIKIDQETNELGVIYSDGLDQAPNGSLKVKVDGTTITYDNDGALTAIGGGGTVDAYTKAETDALLANKITTTAPTSPLEWLPDTDNLIKSSVDDNYNGTSSNYLHVSYSQSNYGEFYDYSNKAYIVNDTTNVTPYPGYTIGTWDDLDTLLCPYIEFDYTTDMVLFDNNYSVVYGYYDTNNKFKEVLCCFRSLRYMYILGEQKQNDVGYRVIDYYEGSNSGYDSPAAILLDKENNNVSYRFYGGNTYGLVTGISQTEIDKITSIRVIKDNSSIYNTPFSKVVTSSNSINSGTWSEFLLINYTNQQPIWGNLHPEQLNLKYDSSTLGVNSNNELYSKIGDGTITLTQGTTTLGTFSVNQSGNTSINIPASGGGGGSTYAAGDGIDISSSDVISAKVDGTTIGIDSSTKEIKLLSSIPTDTSDLTNGAGYITGITSGDVTSALGYTPYNSSNPNGYTSNVGTVTSVNNTQPDGSGNVTLSIPDTTNMVTTNTTQTISGSKTFTTETHHQGVITFDSALGTPIIRGTSGSSYRNMITRSNTYSTVTTGNTSDNLILKGALTRPKYSHDSSDGNYLALYSDIPGDMTGAGASTAGVHGLVPAPAAGDNTKFLRGDGTWQTVSGGGSGAQRMMGEIVTSTVPLTDASVHLLDGSLLTAGGSYDDFITYMAGLYNDGNHTDLFETEANWQASVATYGVCGKYVYTAGSPATLRLPKVTGFIEGAINETGLGDLTEAGLPNITASPTGIWRRTNADMPNFAEGATTIVQDTAHDYVAGTGATPEAVWVASFDASNSNSIYGNSSTVQPQSIKVLYYVVIANTTKTEIQVDIDEIATDLNGKADVDLTNLSDTGKAKVANLGMPSSSSVTVTIPATNGTLTAPYDGYYKIMFHSLSNAVFYWHIRDNITTDYLGAGSFSDLWIWHPVAKGTVTTFNYGNIAVDSAVFVKAIGEVNS